MNIQGIYGRELFETWYRMEAFILSGFDLDQFITHRLPVEEYEQGFEVMNAKECGKVSSGFEIGDVGNGAEQCGGDDHSNTWHRQNSPAYRIGFGKHRQVLVDLYKAAIHRFILSGKSRKVRAANRIEVDITGDQFIPHKGLELRSAGSKHQTTFAQKPPNLVDQCRS